MYNQNNSLGHSLQGHINTLGSARCRCPLPQPLPLLQSSWMNDHRSGAPTALLVLPSSNPTKPHARRGCPGTARNWPALCEPLGVLVSAWDLARGVNRRLGAPMGSSVVLATAGYDHTIRRALLLL